MIFKLKWPTLIVCYCLSYFTLYAATLTANFPIEATVLGSIQLIKLHDMSFGTHALVSSPETVASTQAAQIQVTGDANAAVTGSFDDNLSLTCQTPTSCGSDTISVDTFTCSGNTFNADCTGQIDPSSQSVVNINAVMHLVPANHAGTYTGTQTFALNYN